MLYGPTQPHSKTSIRMYVFRLIYGKPCHLPVKLEHRAYWAIKKLNLSLDQVGKERLLQLQELQKLQNESYQNAEIYKAKMKALNDKHIIRKTFHVHDKVWLYNSHLRLFPKNFPLGGMVHMRSLKHLTLDWSSF